MGFSIDTTCRPVELFRFDPKKQGKNMGMQKMQGGKNREAAKSAKTDAK